MQTEYGKVIVSATENQISQKMEVTAPSIRQKSRLILTTLNSAPAPTPYPVLLKVMLSTAFIGVTSSLR